MKELAMMYWYGSGMSGWGYALMTISMALFWGLIIASAIVVGRRLLREERMPGTAPSTPEDVLAMRLARGEIDEDEYERRTAVLRAREIAGPR
jgi:putative membrane protein